jgi:hypothetical protein
VSVMIEGPARTTGKAATRAIDPTAVHSDAATNMATANTGTAANMATDANVAAATNMTAAAEAAGVGCARRKRGNGDRSRGCEGKDESA